VLGAGVTPDADIRLTVSAGGSYRADFRTSSPFELLSPLLEVAEMRLSLAREGGVTRLDVSGTVRLLRLRGAPPARDDGGAGFGAIEGEVFDASGAVVPGAMVAATRRATGAERSAVTNTEGFYRLDGLAAGEYEVRVFSPGSGGGWSARARVAGGQRVRLDLTLRPDSVAPPSGDDSGWLIVAPKTFTVGAGAFEVTLYAGSDIPLPAGLGSAGGDVRLTLRRDAAGVFGLGVRDVRVRILSTPLTLNGNAATDGSLTLEWGAGTRFPVGAFTVIPDGGGRVAFNLLDPSDPRLQIYFPGGRLESTIPGWPRVTYSGLDLASPVIVWAGQAKGWQDVPGGAVQFLLEGPVISVDLSASTPIARLSVTARTKATKADGTPWLQASTGVLADIKSDGTVDLTLPELKDPNKAARDNCIAKAKADYPDDPLTGFQDPRLAKAKTQCWLDYPGVDIDAPSMSITVGLGDIIA
jgi:hypothetical protein